MYSEKHLDKQPNIVNMSGSQSVVHHTIHHIHHAPQHGNHTQQHPHPNQQHQLGPSQQQTQQQNQGGMFTRFDANKSTKGASKLRRDLINAEIANLRDLLPLPQSTRQRLSQLQLMALVCVYVRKANYFQQVFKRHDISIHHTPTPNIGFSKALSGFLMMLTQNGKLLYISDNAAEYLGHSMEDLLIHGDSVYDIIDKQDHGSIQAELNRNVPQQPGQPQQHQPILEGEHRIFLCRMNVSRNARRQMRFGDQKVVLVQGHYLSFLPLCSRNEPVFLATCTPIAMPETRECVVQGATNVFTTIHSMDMKIMHIDKNGEFHLGYTKSEIQGLSWYHIIHWENIREAQNKHRLITQSEQDRSCILLLRLQRQHGDFFWVHVVLQVRDSQDANQQPVIVCTNQVLNEREASVMLANSWLYHYYSVQSKIQFGLPFEGSSRIPATAPTFYHTHHQPPNIPPNITHSYHSSHHVPYGYHSPVGIPTPPTAGAHHQTSPAAHLINHHQNGNSNNGLGHYSYRYESQPVDYSQTPASPTNGSNQVDIRCSSTNSSNSSSTPLQLNTSSNRISSPPTAKKRIIGKLEPLFIVENSNQSPEAVADIEAQCCRNEVGSITYETILPSRPRILTKAPPPEPPDFIDIWNPSPPWSEGTQKVPDLSSNLELSPAYMVTTTPPTPTSAPPHQNIGGGSAFSFDWMTVGEQFVPIIDSCGLPCLTPEGLPVPVMPVQMTHHWPPDHRIIPLQSSSATLTPPNSNEPVVKRIRRDSDKKDSSR